MGTVKILVDSYGEDLGRHAVYLHNKLMAKQDLPRIAAATRAVIPNYCDACGNRAWGPMFGVTICIDCRAKDEKPVPGFQGGNP